jgi:hypothetical protein
VKILILTYSYAPVANARALRWSAIAEEWARQGHRVTVISATVPRVPHSERRNGVDIQRTGLRALERLRAKVAKRRASGISAGSRLGSTPFASPLQRLWRSIYWPDTSCAWFFPALRRARTTMREAQPDAVVSVSPTFTAALVGLALLPGRGHKPRWLLDLGDPFSWAEEAPPNNYRLYRRLNLIVERAAFRRADNIAVTTAETRLRYAELFREAAGKLIVVPPLAPPDATPSRTSCGNILSLVYVGTLYGAIRRPEFLLQLFRRLLAGPLRNRLQLHFYGDPQDCGSSFDRYSDLLGEAIFVHGAVPREEAVDAMRNAAVLVNIGNRTSYQLPSKIVEYAALAKPILNISTTDADSSMSFLASYPRWLNVRAIGKEPSEQQVRECEIFLSAVAGGGLPEPQGDWAARYRLAEIAARYLALLVP